jgi:hypothetical protein
LQAKGYVDPQGFVVLAGSQAVKQASRATQNFVLAQRKGLLEKGVLVEDGDLHKFSQNYPFTSSSTAAAVLLGSPADGPVEWKNKNDVTLRELRELQSKTPQVDVVACKEIKAEKATSKEADVRTEKAGKLSLVAAAIQVMRETRKPMSAKQVVDAVLAKGLWSSTGKTPDATLYSSILHEIQKKGQEARFRKTDRGLFELKA